MAGDERQGGLQEIVRKEEREARLRNYKVEVTLRGRHLSDTYFADTIGKYFAHVQSFYGRQVLTTIL